MPSPTIANALLSQLKIIVILERRTENECTYYIQNKLYELYYFRVSSFSQHLSCQTQFFSTKDRTCRFNTIQLSMLLKENFSDHVLIKLSVIQFNLLYFSVSFLLTSKSIFSSLQRKYTLFAFIQSNIFDNYLFFLFSFDLFVSIEKLIQKRKFDSFSCYFITMQLCIDVALCCL